MFENVKGSENSFSFMSTFFFISVLINRRYQELVEERLETLIRHVKNSDELRTNLEQQLEIIRKDLNQEKVKLYTPNDPSDNTFLKSRTDKLNALSRINTDDSEISIPEGQKTKKTYGSTNALKLGYFFGPYLKCLQTGLGPDYCDDMRKRNDALGQFKNSGFVLPQFSKNGEERLVLAVKEYVHGERLRQKVKPLINKKEEIEAKIELVKNQETDRSCKKSREEQRKTLQNYRNGQNSAESRGMPKGGDHKFYIPIIEVDLCQNYSFFADFRPFVNPDAK